MPLWRESLSQIFTQRAFLYHAMVCFSVIQGKDLFLPLSSLLAIFTDHMTSLYLQEHE